jgi:hypothetical protein
VQACLFESNAQISLLGLTTGCAIAHSCCHDPFASVLAYSQGLGVHVLLVHVQRYWWRALATCCLALATSPRRVPMTTVEWIPARHCLPYFSGQAYTGRSEMVPAIEDAAAYLSPVLQGLLVGQLWEVWPWQLQELGRRSGGPAAAAAEAMTAAAAAVVSTSAGFKMAAGGSSTSARSSSIGSNSSSSRSSGGAGPPPGTAADGAAGHWLPGAFITYPLRPPQAHGVSSAGEAAAGAVTLQQLQLAVCTLAHADGVRRKVFTNSLFFSSRRLARFICVHKNVHMKGHACAYNRSIHSLRPSFVRVITLTAWSSFSKHRPLAQPGWPAPLCTGSCLAGAC